MGGKVRGWDVGSVSNGEVLEVDWRQPKVASLSLQEIWFGGFQVGGSSGGQESNPADGTVALHCMWIIHVDNQQAQFAHFWKDTSFHNKVIEQIAVFIFNAINNCGLKWVIYDSNSFSCSSGCASRCVWSA